MKLVSKIGSNLPQSNNLFCFDCGALLYEYDYKLSDGELLWKCIHCPECHNFELTDYGSGEIEIKIRHSILTNHTMINLIMDYINNPNKGLYDRITNKLFILI